MTAEDTRRTRTVKARDLTAYMAVVKDGAHIGTVAAQELIKDVARFLYARKYLGEAEADAFEDDLRDSFAVYEAEHGQVTR